MNKLLLLFSILAVSLTACKKDRLKLSETNYLVFGEYYSFCQGECVVLYRIDSNRVLKAQKPPLPYAFKPFYAGTYTLLPQQKFAITQDLIKDFPMDLLTEPSRIIGEPDAGDWGGFYVEYNFNGVRKSWLIDKMRSNLPTKYLNFADKMDEKLKLLR